MPSLRSGHAHLLCTVSIISDDLRRSSTTIGSAPIGEAVSRKAGPAACLNGACGCLAGNSSSWPCSSLEAHPRTRVSPLLLGIGNGLLRRRRCRRRRQRPCCKLQRRGHDCPAGCHRRLVFGQAPGRLRRRLVGAGGAPVDSPAIGAAAGRSTTADASQRGLNKIGGGCSAGEVAKHDCADGDADEPFVGGGSGPA